MDADYPTKGVNIPRRSTPDIRPGVCLYLTDMLCSSYPETEPACPVLWVNYGSPPKDWNREPWGERIDIARH